ncbi:MAG: HAD family hydrolase [bacterium]|nr:HAD family hydrolase [bacterium]
MSRLLRGLIFDFDGLIVDTETARYYAWKEVIESHGVELPLSVWHENIGLPSEAFDPLEYLKQRAIAPVDLEAVRKRKNEVFWDRMEGETLRPGIKEYLEEGKRRGLKIAICSSSPRRWIEQNLPRWGIDGQFDAIVTGSDVERIKPDPELYLKVLALLQLPAESCIAFEDSPKGVQSAKAAGIFCVAVPNSITLETDLAGADVKVHSLSELPLEDLERRFSTGHFLRGFHRRERRGR